MSGTTVREAVSLSASVTGDGMMVLKFQHAEGPPTEIAMRMSGFLAACRQLERMVEAMKGGPLKA